MVDLRAVLPHFNALDLCTRHIRLFPRRMHRLCKQLPNPRRPQATRILGKGHFECGAMKAHPYHKAPAQTVRAQGLWLGGRSGTLENRLIVP